MFYFIEDQSNSYRIRLVVCTKVPSLWSMANSFLYMKCISGGFGERGDDRCSDLLIFCHSGTYYNELLDLHDK